MTEIDFLLPFGEKKCLRTFYFPTMKINLLERKKKTFKINTIRVLQERLRFGFFNANLYRDHGK